MGDPDSDDTLFTFLVDFPKKASLVTIVGSWDNFQTPYPLQKDSRGGRAMWRRYSNFNGIVCDGDRLKSKSEGRDGALKMGGTYWYYFQIDNDGEHCDPASPKTRTCPLLPGQEVNVLEVPQKSSEPRMSCESMTSLVAYTLNPEAKYAMLQDKTNDQIRMKKHPVTPGGCAVQESDGMGTYFSSRPQSNHRSPGSQARSSRKRLLSIQGSQYELERPPTKKRMLAWRPKTAPLLAASRRLYSRAKREIHTSSETCHLVSRCSASPPKAEGMYSAMLGKFSQVVSPKSFSHRSKSSKSSNCESLVSGVAPFKPGLDYLSYPRPGSRPGTSMQFDWGGDLGTDFAGSVNDAQVSKEESTSAQQGLPKSALLHSKTTSTRSSTFYSSLHLTGTHSKTEATMSYPTTPSSRLSFETGASPSRRSRREASILWYKGNENPSILTLQNVNKLPDDSDSTPQNPRSKRVEEWTSQVEGSAESDVEQICNDMAYLRAMIT